MWHGGEWFCLPTKAQISFFLWAEVVAQRDMAPGVAAADCTPSPLLAPGLAAAVGYPEEMLPEGEVNAEPAC